MAAGSHEKFERFISELTKLESEEMLERAMDLSEESVRTVPMRFRIIALGFANARMTLDDVNRMLEEKGCAKLYARSFWEATIIYALNKKYSYEKWKELYEKCKDLSKTVDSFWFSGKNVSYGELKRYLQENSQTENGIFKTDMRTQQIEGALRETTGGDMELYAFLLDNIYGFSDVRERARYYFCKYLYYFVNRRIETFMTACREDWDEERYEATLTELKCLKRITKLRRHKGESEEIKRQWIAEAPLSYGYIFQAFEDFYGCYTSTDWIASVMEKYEEKAEKVPQPLRFRLIEALFGTKREQKHAKENTDVYLQRMEAWKIEQEKYGGVRKWETVAREYMRGTRDIDRTALICYLTYLSSDAQMPEEHTLTEERLNEILERCGYNRLDPDNDFDGTVVEFILNGTWDGVLEEAVHEAANKGENSKWYNFYYKMGTFENKLKEVILPKK